MNRIVTGLYIGRNSIESTLCKWHQFTAEVLVNLIRPPDKNIRDIDTKIETGYLTDLFYNPPKYEAHIDSMRSTPVDQSWMISRM